MWQGCSEVRPVEGRLCSAALKSEDRKPKTEGNPKSEIRRACGWLDLFGFRVIPADFRAPVGIVLGFGGSCGWRRRRKAADLGIVLLGVGSLA